MLLTLSVLCLSISALVLDGVSFDQSTVMAADPPPMSLDLTCPPEGTWDVDDRRRVSTYTGEVTFQWRKVDPASGDETICRQRRRLSVTFPFPLGYRVNPPPSIPPPVDSPPMSPLYSQGGGGWRNWGEAGYDASASPPSSSTVGLRLRGTLVEESEGEHDPLPRDESEEPEERPPPFRAFALETPAAEDRESAAALPEREDTPETIP